jgi:hypothetical protein
MFRRPGADLKVAFNINPRGKSRMGRVLRFAMLLALRCLPMLSADSTLITSAC